jgi:hypothetical protein
MSEGVRGDVALAVAAVAVAAVAVVVVCEFASLAESGEAAGALLASCLRDTSS